jgi:HSP20 family protein
MRNYYLTRRPQMAIPMTNPIGSLAMLADAAVTAPTVPPIELGHTADQVILKAELPGLKPENLDITVTPDAVLLKGHYSTTTTTEHQQIYRTELRSGSFQRTIPLPVAVDHTAATATFEQGILTLMLPKQQVIKPQAVKVAIGAVDAVPAAVGSSPVDPPLVQPESESALRSTPENSLDDPTIDAWQ